ncbi:hypothetical protein CC80DRAFT_169098 [Byssothecium circinans]|uniref:Uncharacterized protein n=1 Tax=Byssothecium circinans TaxID=147558 RepID=A0A6A5TLZ1_9PLEO|nr:hypothetical protein CC80DRAFT_169098 [Byssothecium circinans]
MRKDLQADDDGRGTPLPQYEKTPLVPFTLTLQEEKDNPGQFQLVVNIDSQRQPPHGGNLQPSASKKLIASLKEVPSLGYDVSPLYHTLKSSPPSSPQEEKGWSDLDAIPPEFLEKVVPDWKVTFSRSDTTASVQSRKLADIKAKIKKSGHGFLVRLLKGSNAETEANEVAEVHLGQHTKEISVKPVVAGQIAELATGCRPAELDATCSVPAIENSNPATNVEVFELPTNEPTRSTQPALDSPSPSVSHWLQQAVEPSRRTSVLEEGWFSDAETLRSDVRSVADRLEETDIEPLSRYSSAIPTRSASVFSIVKTPTRGLSVVGPIRRVERAGRVRGKGKSARSDLNRSGAHKSIRRHSPRTSTHNVPTMGAVSTMRDSSLLQPPYTSSDESGSNETARKAPRRSSKEELTQAMAKSKSQLRLQTDVPQATSANSSPVTKRKRSPRTRKSATFSSSVDIVGSSHQAEASPVWSEVDPSDELRAALDDAFGNINHDERRNSQESRPVPKTQEPVDVDEIGDMALPPGLEIRMPPSTTRSPVTTFWGLALSALSERALEVLSALRDRYGSDPPVPANHVRVRWTCSCGEPLHDDFIERRPGAARLLEAYLNRPRAHTPTSPSTRTSTATSMSSVFDANSRASTLTTPASTYGGASSWGKHSDPSKYSPTRLRSNNPFSVRIGTFIEESWLLTCANEGRFTPKIVHVDVNAGRIKCDKDLALALREHYERVNRGWFKWARLRGLSTIEFVQFEVHRNRFADIRASPSMPPTSSTSTNTNDKSPSQHPYTFEPNDLMPPVGSAYLLHLFKHPEDYDGESITYLRAPKRRERLEFGMGWGINLVEGFLAQKVWAVVMVGFGIGSAVFAVMWTVRMGDVQGAFGVASWVVTLAGLGLGGLQAWLE